MASGFHTHGKLETADVRCSHFVVEHDPLDLNRPYKAYKAGCGMTFAGNDAATVIQQAIDSLTPGRTWVEEVLIKGDFSTLSSDITIPSYTRIKVAGKIDHTKLLPALNSTKVFLEDIMGESKEFVVPTNGGWSSSNAGSGGVSMYPLYLVAKTGTSASSRGHACCYAYFLNSSGVYYYLLDWSKRLELSFTAMRSGNDSEAVARFQLKESNSEGQLAEKGLGITVNNYSVVGESYGTSRGTVGLGTLTDNVLRRFKIVLVPGVRVEFWSNSVLTGVLTGNYVPANPPSAPIVLNASIINGATGGVDAFFVVNDVDIIQEW